MLELAVEPDQGHLRIADTASDDGNAVLDLRESLYGSKNVWQYEQKQDMADGSVNVQQYVAEVRAITEAEDAASPTAVNTRARMRTQTLLGGNSSDPMSTHQLTEQEQVNEMNISMRLQEEAEEEEKALDSCASPLQVCGPQCLIFAICARLRTIMCRSALSMNFTLVVLAFHCRRQGC